MKSLFTILLPIIFFFSCQNSTNKKQDKKNISITDTLLQDTSKSKNAEDEILKTIPKNIQPVFGYRFIISGDFDGNGKKEMLIEHFYSGIDNKETNKFYDSLPNYDQLVALTIKKSPYSFVISDNKQIDTLHISSSAQLLGLSYLKNEGDLNGDGTDDISYVVNWADWSNLNTWHIMTYKNNTWIELYSFPIWDWQIPDLPQTFNQYGLFGLEQKIINTTNDSINKQIEKELLAYKGLVKKIKTNKIRVIYRNEEADEDTMFVILNQLK